jgi:hypothetical protein
MGTRVSHGFLLDSERYAFDFGGCSYERGWAQVDTNQDASYFGVWTNPTERKIFTFAEGDTTLVECDTDAEYQTAILSTLLCYRLRDGGHAKIDVCIYHPDHPLRGRFVALGLASYLH